MKLLSAFVNVLKVLAVHNWLILTAFANKFKGIIIEIFEWVAYGKRPLPSIPVDSVAQAHDAIEVLDEAIKRCK